MSPVPAPDRACLREQVARAWRVRGDAGSAVVEFTLVSIVLIGLFLAILQLGLALHVRNTLVASAAEGARLGASADRGAEDGAAHARALIADALAERYAESVVGDYETVDGVATVVVRVEAALPVIGLLGPDRSLQVSGHALEEAAP